MKRNIFRHTTIVIILVLLVSFVGCSKAENDSTEVQESTKKAEDVETSVEKNEVIKITYPTYRVGVQVSSETERILIKEFNEQYAGRIEVVVEELPSDTAYTDKMKILASANELPDIVEGKNGMLDAAVDSEQAIDLTPYLEADPEFKALIGQAAIDANSRNGKAYSISFGQLLVGYFYNKEQFSKVGIKPAETWEEFLTNCEKLKEAGFTPLSLGTGENAWTVNLLLASMVGTSGEDGNTFMNTFFPTSYDTPEMIDSLNTMKKLLTDYTTSDAIGGLYANAANNFMQGKTAMIANGPWMIPDFSNPEKALPNFLDQVGVAAYPGSGMFTSFLEGYMICSKDKEHADAAWEFVKFKTNARAQQLGFENDGLLPLTDKVQVSDEFKTNNKLLIETVSLGTNVKYRYEFFDTISSANVIDTFSRTYPEFVYDKITVEEFVAKLSEAAIRNK